MTAAQNSMRQQEALNQAAMMQRFPVRPLGPPISMAGMTPVSSMSLVSPMRPAMIPGPPTLIGGHLMRPPPLGMPPGTSSNIRTIAR